MITTRSIGPLHFEDLEPKRFEDLVRQLAYEFRAWRKLEATGRSGSDDGFDARGLEIVAGDGGAVETEDEDSDNQGEIVTTDRLWLIQCKRERRIGPTGLVKYLGEIRLQPGEALHGLVFAAACDFSKKAHDQFNEKCRAVGLQECYLWGKAAIEDLLFQPKNDHLLFAYFGFSLSIRQRTLQAPLRRDIATKKRVKAVIERSTNRMIAIRNASEDIYPKVPPQTERFADRHWRICPYKEINHKGLVVEFAAHLAFLDGESWDAADALGLRRSQLYFGRWDRDIGNNEAYGRQQDMGRIPS